MGGLNHTLKRKNTQESWMWGTTFLGQHMQHNYWLYYLLDDIIGSNPQIRSIVELGTGFGALTIVLGLHAVSLNIPMYSVDIDATKSEAVWPLFDQLRIHHVEGDAFSDKIIAEIENFIAGQCTYVVCDDGNKIREFKLWSPKIPIGSLISVHDWDDEICMEDIANIVNGKVFESYKPERWSEMMVQFATFVKKKDMGASE